MLLSNNRLQKTQNDALFDCHLEHVHFAQHDKNSEIEIGIAECLSVTVSRTAMPIQVVQ
jgi:hypothetical protein